MDHVTAKALINFTEYSGGQFVKYANHTVEITWDTKGPTYSETYTKSANGITVTGEGMWRTASASIFMDSHKAGDFIDADWAVVGHTNAIEIALP
jgi:hypothetical protein